MVEEITLNKKRGQKLGLILYEDKEGNVFVKAVNENGAAAGMGIEADDQITACNGKSFILISKNDALESLKNAGSSVRLSIDKKKGTGPPSAKKRKTTSRTVNGESDTAEEMKREIEKLQAENEHLRAALKRICSTSTTALKK